MAVLATKEELHISVKAFPRDTRGTKFAPVVTITDTQQVIVNITTTQEFSTVPEAENHGFALAEQWLNGH